MFDSIYGLDVVAKLVIFITIFNKSGDKKSGGDGGDKVVINEKNCIFPLFFILIDFD